MDATTKISLEEFQKLQEAADENVRYELDEGELILTPPSIPWHNILYLRLWRTLDAFVRKHHLGLALTEVDFHVGSNTIRKPDVAFITRDQLKTCNLDKNPISGAPSLAVEVVSPSNLAQDIAKKVRQYLAAGSEAVWVIYPSLKLIEIHDRESSKKVTVGGKLVETRPFAGSEFTLSLTEFFVENLDE